MNGFNENLIFYEDTDYVKRFVKSSFKFQILKSTRIYYSTRRIKKEGRLVYEYKMIKYFFFRKITVKPKRNLSFCETSQCHVFKIPKRRSLSKLRISLDFKWLVLIHINPVSHIFVSKPFLQIPLAFPLHYRSL